MRHCPSHRRTSVGCFRSQIQRQKCSIAFTVYSAFSNYIYGESNIIIIIILLLCISVWLSGNALVLRVDPLLAD